MFRKNALLPRAAMTLGFIGLTALTIILVSMMVTKQFVGLPIVLLVLLGWVGMFLLRVILPIIAVIQILASLNRKLFSRA